MLNEAPLTHSIKPNFSSFSHGYFKYQLMEDFHFSRKPVFVVVVSNFSWIAFVSKITNIMNLKTYKMHYEASHAKLVYS